METVHEPRVDAIPEAAGALGHGKLTVLDVVAQAVGFIGPVFSVAFFLTAIAGLGADRQGRRRRIPIALIAGTIGIAASRGSSRGSRSGSTRRARSTTTSPTAFGRRAGFVAGWTTTAG